MVGHGRATSWIAGALLSVPKLPAPHLQNMCNTLAYIVQEKLCRVEATGFDPEVRKPPAGREALGVGIERKKGSLMRRITGIVLSVALLALALSATSAFAQAGGAKVRAIHASPDAPAVDIWVDGNKALTNVPFKAISDYLNLPAGSHQLKVVPTGATEPAVIDATVEVEDGMAYTIIASGLLASIEPIVLTDDSPAPAAGKAHVRFVHLSPDAPAVDIAVEGGPVVFNNIAYGASGEYTPVDAGTYDLEARPTGTQTVALAVPGVELRDGVAYTVYAVGLAGGQPALSVITSQDAIAEMPAVLPSTGDAGAATTPLLLLAAGFALLLGALGLRSRTA